MSRRAAVAAIGETQIDPFLTIEETMRLLKVSRATVDRMRAKGTLKSARKLGYPRILGSSVKALLDEAVRG